MADDDERRAEMHALLDDDKFRPFGNVFGDFDYDAFGERMRFRPLQRELFQEIIRQLDIQIWFWDEDKTGKDLRDDPPGLELVVFMPCGCAGDTLHISSANLLEMLERAFVPFRRNDWTEIGCDEEIAVLEKLKALCDEGIKYRRDVKARQEAKKENK